MDLELMLQQVEQSQQRTLSIKRELEQVLEQTRSDITAVHWQTATPQLINDALTQIHLCCPAERSIEEAARQRLDAVKGEDLQQIIHLLHLLESAKVTQAELHGLLIQARGVFLDEQLRQCFAPPPSLTTRQKWTRGASLG